MRGVLIRGDKEAVVESFPDPSPQFGEVVVRMKAAAICGTDLHDYRRSAQERKPGAHIIVGHEPCGVVEALGEGVRRIRKGDRVVVYPVIGCGHCKYCLSGDIEFCKDAKFVGSDINGADADLIVCPERNCLALPDEMSFEEGAIVACNVGTAYQALERVHASGLTTLAVFGLGPVGQSAVLVGKAMGARVIGVDVVEERLTLTRELGCDVLINAEKQDPVKVIRQVTGGQGADIALDFAGTPPAQTNALDCVGAFGQVGFVGVGGPLTLKPTEQLILKQMTIVGSWHFKICEYENITRFVLDHALPLNKLVTHRFPIEDAPEAFGLFEQRRIGKVMFLWS